MSGRNPFSELTKDFTPERRRRIKAMKNKLLADMPLHELRRARALTQRELAGALNVNQPAVAKLEQRADIYVSSLRSYIEAVGGRLKIIAEFPDGEVTITNFSRLGESDTDSEGGNQKGTKDKRDRRDHDNRRTLRRDIIDTRRI